MSEDPGAEDFQESDQAESQSSRRSPLVWVAIWLIVALVVVAVIATSGLVGAPDVTPTPSQPPTSAEPSVEASAPASSSDRSSIGSGIGVDWTAVATFAGQGVNDLTAGGPGWVAVGSEGPVGCEVCPGLEEYTGKVWTSTDGRSWDDAAVPGLEGAVLYDVAAGPGGLVAVGLFAVDGVSQRLVLVSADGIAWEPVSGTALQGPGVFIGHLVGGPRYVAVGSVAAGQEPAQPGIWTSTDGRAWVEAFISDQGGSIFQVERGGPGWVAVGLVDHPGSGERSAIPFPAYWESADAVSWTELELPLPAFAAGGVAGAVLASQFGMVAVGSGEYPPPEAPGPVLGFAGWHATDTQWEASPVTDDFLEDIGGGILLYESPDRVFALGSGCRCGTGTPYRWWTSTDGLAWVEHAETPPVLYTVVPFDGGLIAAGIEDGEGAIFISE